MFLRNEGWCIDKRWKGDEVSLRMNLWKLKSVFLKKEKEWVCILMESGQILGQEGEGVEMRRVFNDLLLGLNERGDGGILCEEKGG